MWHSQLNLFHIIRSIIWVGQSVSWVMNNPGRQITYFFQGEMEPIFLHAEDIQFIFEMVRRMWIIRMMRIYAKQTFLFK